MAKIYIGETILSDDNAIINGAPELLNTLDELAAALGDDENYATSTATSLGNRLRIDVANQALTGIQLVNAKTNLDLENVTNESKATMFSDPTFTGTVSGLVGDGSGLTTLDAGNISSGTINKDRLPLATDITSLGQLSTVNVSGSVTIGDDIQHLGDSDTQIRFPADNTFTVETGGAERLRVIDDGIGINKTPERTLDMNGHFRLLITPENRVDGESTALIKGTDGRAANLSVQGPVSVTHDLFKNSGQTNGFADNSNHFHTIQKINRITQQNPGEVKNIERVQEQYYAIQNNNLRGSNAAFWNWHRVSRSIDNTAVSLTDLSGWNVQNIQDSTNRTDAGQVPFTQSENTTFTFATTNPFTNGDILQVKIDIDFEGPLVAATHFAKVTAVNGLSATVVLYNGNYKSTNEVDLSTGASPTPGNADPQTALTTNFSVTKIDTSNNLLPTDAGFSAGSAFQKSFRTLLGGQGARTGKRVFKFKRNGVADGLAAGDVLTIITTGGGYKEAEVATVLTVSTTQVTASYGRIFDSDPDLPATYHPNGILAILKGSLDGLHRITTGDTLMNFNADNLGRYKSFQIGPGNEIDGNCIAIGKNVYNNIDKSIRIGYEPDNGSGDATNHLLITPTYTETIKPLSTQGLQALRIDGEQTMFADITYDAGIHRFRDFDETPNDMLVIKKAAHPTTGATMPEALVGINTDTPDAALHIVGQGARTDNVVLKAIGSGLFSSTNDIALHLKVDTANTGHGSRILKLQQDSTNENQGSSERMNLGFIGTGGGGTYTGSTPHAAFIEVENNREFEIAIGGTKSFGIFATGVASFNNSIAVNGNIMFNSNTIEREIRISNSTSGDGGNLQLIAGSSSLGDTDGGDVHLIAGGGNDNGVNGHIILEGGSGASEPDGDVQLKSGSSELKVTYSDTQVNKRLVASQGVQLGTFTTTERNAIISPQDGLMIYNSTDNAFQGYKNGGWVNLG